MVCLALAVVCLALTMRASKPAANRTLRMICALDSIGRYERCAMRLVTVDRVIGRQLQCSALKLLGEFLVDVVSDFDKPDVLSTATWREGTGFANGVVEDACEALATVGVAAGCRFQMFSASHYTSVDLLTLTCRGS